MGKPTIVKTDLSHGLGSAEALWIECLANMQKALAVIQSRHINRKWWCKPVVEARGSEVQGYRWLCTEFEVSLGYVRPCLQNKAKQSPVLGALDFIGRPAGGQRDRHHLLPHLRFWGGSKLFCLVLLEIVI